jgi:hypothetical protein
MYTLEAGVQNVQLCSRTVAQDVQERNHNLIFLLQFYEAIFKKKKNDSHVVASISMIENTFFLISHNFYD